MAVPESALTWPRSVVNSKSRVNLASWGAIAGAAVVGLDPVIHATVLPVMSSAMQLDVTQRTLIASASTLLFIATLLATGVLGDRWGRRRVLLGGCALVVFGELTTAAATGFGVLLVGRIICGVGLAGMFSMSLAVIPTFCTRAQAAKVFGRMFAVVAVASFVGSLGSALLADRFGWRWAYAFSAMLVFVIAVYGLLVVPESRAATRKSLDAFGLILAASGLFVTMLGIGRISSGSSQLLNAATIATGLALLACFVLVERRATDPGFPIGLLRLPEFSSALLAVAAVYLALGAVQVQVPEVLELSRRLSFVDVSLVLSPFVVGGLVGALTASALHRRGLPAGRLLLGGMGLVALGIVPMVFFSSGSSVVGLMIGWGVAGVGLMATMTVATTVIMEYSNEENRGTVGSLKPIVGQLGYALGLGIFVPIVAGIDARDAGRGVPLVDSAYDGFDDAMAIVVVLIFISIGAVALLSRRARQPR